LLIHRSGEGLKKTQLEILLDEHLTNHAELATDARVAPFYKRRSTSDLSPVKKESSVALHEAEKAVKSVKRRVTKAAEELVNSVYVPVPPRRVNTAPPNSHILVGEQ
jgi:hypothetical protein